MAGSDEHNSESSSSTPDVEDNPSGYVDPDSFEAFAPDGPADMLIPNPMAAAGAMMRAQNKEQRAERQEALEDGDGFEFDADELRALRDEWKELAEHLSQLRRDTRRLGKASAPADDDASKYQIKAVHQHAQACSAIHDQMYEYAREYSDRLDDALNKLQESDASAHDAVQATGRDMR